MSSSDADEITFMREKESQHFIVGRTQPRALAHGSGSSNTSPGQGR